MEPEFNIDQVFQIAWRIQQNVADFYQKMAELFFDRRSVLCLELANQRAEKAKALTKERRRFCDKYGKPVTFDYRDYIMSHPSEMADLSIFSHERYHSIPLSGRESREEILRDAIGRCEAVIIFFQGLREFTHDTAAVRALHKIIDDENIYINLLRKRANVWSAFGKILPK
jgi:rubrerythrin